MGAIVVEEAVALVLDVGGLGPHADRHLRVLRDVIHDPQLTTSTNQPRSLAASDRRHSRKSGAVATANDSKLFMAALISRRTNKHACKSGARE